MIVDLNAALELNFFFFFFCLTHARNVFPAPAIRFISFGFDIESNIALDLKGINTWPNAVKRSTETKKPLCVRIIVKYPFTRSVMPCIA